MIRLFFIVLLYILFDFTLRFYVLLSFDQVLFAFSLSFEEWYIVHMLVFYPHITILI